MPILDTIAGPDDLRKLGFDELRALAAELRSSIVSAVESRGGHLASNLGVVELTIALHRVFESPRDAIVWDVGHQCYAHKMLTGRAGRFDALRALGGLSGFPRRSESPHDPFDEGHASVSISRALGLLAARHSLKVPGSVVAFIGDGALTGGLAWEALQHAGQLQLPLVVVLNDNAMSISPNVGSISRYLSRLSATPAYQAFRRRVDRAILSVPRYGRRVHALVVRAKRAVKELVFRETVFSDFGFEYVGPVDGHDLELLCAVLSEAKALGRPVVVHALTRKGRGHAEAEEDPSTWHGVAPASGAPSDPNPSFTKAFSAAMLAAGARDPRVVAVTAAMAGGTGLSAFQTRFPERFHDVGIAEEHAVAFAGGLARGGRKPVVAIYSTFMQRAVDQVFHDVVLQDLPVVLAMDRAGAVPEDGQSHQGAYDVAIFRAFPRLPILAPSTAAELAAALDWALARDGPCAIRYPKAPCMAERPELAAPWEPGRGVFLERFGAPTLVAAWGGLVPAALGAAALARERGAALDVLCLRFLAPLDGDAFASDCSGYRRVLILEEGVERGGASEGLALALRERAPGVEVLRRGFPDEPFAHGRRDELLALAGLDAPSVAALALGPADREAAAAPGAVDVLERRRPRAVRAGSAP